MWAEEDKDKLKRERRQDKGTLKLHRMSYETSRHYVEAHEDEDTLQREYG